VEHGCGSEVSKRNECGGYSLSKRRRWLPCIAVVLGNLDGSILVTPLGCQLAANSAPRMPAISAPQAFKRLSHAVYADIALISITIPEEFDDSNQVGPRETRCSLWPPGNAETFSIFITP
jgi:hypothetical protein